MKCLASVTLSCLALAQFGHGQSPTAPNSEAPSLRANSTLVLVPALIRNKHGNLVFSLTSNDFVITDDGIPQKVTLEQDTGGEPLALVVVIEIGGAGAREFDKLAPLPSMIESVVGEVPHNVAVVAFDSQSTLLQNFTSDLDAVKASVLDLIPPCSRQNHVDNCAAQRPLQNVRAGDNGAAILDSLGFSVDLLRKQPSGYRRAILLISETLDRGSHLKLEDAIRAITDTNTTIYSIGFSTGKSEAAHYASRELPTRPSQPNGSWLSLENLHPNPSTGCMSKDANPDPDASRNKGVQTYDCMTQLAPPLALAKMAAIAMSEGLRRNIPETVARITGGEYFKLTDAKSLEESLGTISNHIPNRYIISFQPQSPHSGLHLIDLRLRDYSNLEVTARSRYWADSEGK
jgi:VWFA-related protein